MYLEELTGNITLENSEVECKARLDRSNPQSWIKQSEAFQTLRAGPSLSVLKIRPYSSSSPVSG